MQEKKCISLLQLAILVITISFGTGPITLVRQMAEEGKQNMWLIVLLGIIPLTTAFWFAVKLCRCFPQQSVIEFNKCLAGKFVGNFLNIFLLILMTLITSSFLRSFRIIIKGFLLDLTPSQVIVSVILLAAVYCCQNGLGPLLRFQQLVFETGYTLFILVILIGLLNIEVNNYEPFLSEGITPLLKGVKDTWYAFSGSEILILFLYPYLTMQKKTFTYGFYGIGFLTCLYVLITGIVQGVLGYEEVKHQLFPTIMAYREVEIPATFIERVDGYLVIFWIAVAFISIMLWIYLISLGISQMFGNETTRPVLWLLVPIILYIQNVPPDIQSAEILQMWVNTLGIIWGLLITPILWFIARYKQRREEC